MHILTNKWKAFHLINVRLSLVNVPLISQNKFLDKDDDDFIEPSAKRLRRDGYDDKSVGFHVPGGDVNPPSGINPPPGINLLRMPKKQKVPTIFFGTRTHKQVSQIVRKPVNLEYI